MPGWGGSWGLGLPHIHPISQNAVLSVLLASRLSHTVSGEISSLCSVSPCFMETLALCFPGISFMSF